MSRIWREAEPGTLPFNFVGMHDSLADALAATTGLVLTDGGERDGDPHAVGSIVEQDKPCLVGGIEPMQQLGNALDAQPRRVQRVHRGGLIKGEDDVMSR